MDVIMVDICESKPPKIKNRLSGFVLDEVSVDDLIHEMNTTPFNVIKKKSISIFHYLHT